MASKRKSDDLRGSAKDRSFKKPKRDVVKPSPERKLIFTARPDWHAADLPPLGQSAITTLPTQKVIDELQEHAKQLLAAENAAYQTSQSSASASQKFLSTIMTSGTLEDKVSALTLLIQESPLHAVKAFEQLASLGRKKSRDQALMAIAALKDLLGQGMVLPSDRKLRAFGKQPGLLAALQGKAGRWTAGQPLPSGLQDIHLIAWAFEDWLKKAFFEFLQTLELWCNDEVEYARVRATTYVWELLRDKPEQEENLLRLLVNKLGDTDRKIASRASHLLLQLENTHPAMKLIITNSIEADCLFKPGQSRHAKYYGIITLNQTILSTNEQELAGRLLDVYFALFIQLLKPISQDLAQPKPKAPAKPQGGGGKAGKMAAKKRKAEERSDEAEIQLRDKLVAQVLAGVNRAFPFADTDAPSFEKQMDAIFRVAHSANFNTSVQALMLIQQISNTKHYGADRFYRTLYESLLDPRSFTSSKQVMYLNLLYKSLKNDLNVKRVQAFVKRLLQVITLHEPPFICGVLYLISHLTDVFPGIRKMLTDHEVNEEEEEEHFVDVDVDAEDQDPAATTSRATTQSNSTSYDGRKRNPEHAQAERSCLWDILPMLQHFHPSVALFSSSIYANEKMPPQPDPTKHTLMSFLDRFVYRNARTKQVVPHGSSIMQPMGGRSGADLLLKPKEAGSNRGPLNTDDFWSRKVEDVAADEVFFHSYFNAGVNKKAKASKDKLHRTLDSDEEDEDGEDEIWKAIAQSRPEVEGEDEEDDDLSMGDLESAYEKSDDESEAGIDLGGEGGGDDDLADMFSDEVEAADETEGEDDVPNLDSDDDDAMLGDDDEVPFQLADEQDLEEAEKDAPRKKRKDKKKLKSLPTFASADDYAKLLADEPDDL